VRPDIETHELPDGSCLLFDPVSYEGHALDILGALVWDYCDGTLTSDEIASAIAELVPNDVRLREEVRRFLNEFARHGLLHTEASTETDY
jgi:hypothetical protein